MKIIGFGLGLLIIGLFLIYWFSDEHLEKAEKKLIKKIVEERYGLVYNDNEGKYMFTKKQKHYNS